MIAADAGGCQGSSGLRGKNPVGTIEMRRSTKPHETRCKHVSTGSVQLFGRSGIGDAERGRIGPEALRGRAGWGQGKRQKYNNRHNIGFGRHTFLLVNMLGAARAERVHRRLRAVAVLFRSRRQERYTAHVFVTVGRFSAPCGYRRLAGKYLLENNGLR
jgi:hypothetical protein